MNSYLHVHNFSSAKSLFAAIALGGAIVIAAPVSAHHGTAPNYKMDETILLKGTVTEFRMENLAIGMVGGSAVAVTAPQQAQTPPLPDDPAICR